MGHPSRLLLRATGIALLASIGLGFAARQVAAARVAQPIALAETAASTTATIPARTDVAVSAPTAGGAGSAVAVAEPPATARGTLTVMHLRSAYGDGALRDVWVYRPAVPDTARLPVLYFLHGVPGAPGDVFGAGLAAVLDQAFARGAAPFVVVAPDGRGHAHPDTEWADSTDGTDRVETFVTEVVIPAVEGANRRDRTDRALAGFSMGGYGALNLAERHPELFGQLVSLAGYFHVDDPDHMFAGDAGTVAANSPDRHLEVVRRFRLLLADGDHDAEPVVSAETERFAGLLAQAGIPALVAVTPGAHDWAWVSRQLPAMVGFLEAGWSSL